MYVYLVSIKLITFFESFSEKRLTLNQCANCLLSRQKTLQLLMQNCLNISILHGCISRRQYTVECSHQPFRRKILIPRINIQVESFKKLATDATCSNEETPLEGLAPHCQTFRISSTSWLTSRVFHLNM